MNTYSTLIKESRLYPIVVLDRMLSHRVRHSIHQAIDSILVLLIILLSVAYIIRFLPLNEDVSLTRLTAYIPHIVGLGLILLALLIAVYLLELFFRFSYFREHTSTWRTRGRRHERDLLSFRVLKILYAVRNGDIAKSFCNDAVGKNILFRVGISPAELNMFLKNRNHTIAGGMLPLASETIFGIVSLAKYLLTTDIGFKDFLFQNGVHEHDFMGATAWVSVQEKAEKDAERWWARERLARMRGIGKNWSYGAAYTLMHYGHEILEEYTMHGNALSIKNEREVREMERVLSREGEANVLLVGEKGVGTLDIIFDFAKEIREGVIAPQLEHKRVCMLNTNAIIASVRGKQEFEELMLTLFTEATKAGDFVLVFPDFPAFIKSAQALGSDVVNIIDPYLASQKLQVIGVTDSDGFHSVIEPYPALMARLEKVLVTEPSRDEMIMILERVAENLESHEPVFFTYSAIEEALQSAENYLSDGVFLDKAIDLLVEAVPQARAQGETFIKQGDILSLITKKTNIPLGDLSDGERMKLMNLESFLHQRIVGQDEAVKLIADAMRRARVGVRNMKRPIGSFLFLGPTGVGKTETVKALSQAFFGAEDIISRFDMSEYQTADALERLIGYFEGGQVGTLTKTLKDKPFGILLLDEFEKTNPEVLDLFLQILDEGFFSDMRGKRVNARNVIIIATSNAGSNLIWDAVKQKTELISMKREIIDVLIKRSLFKPELLNRFDAVVLFHPLGERELSMIARLMLGKLAQRLRERGLELIITEELLQAVVRHGMDPAFGARPMNRAIQEKIEQVIAEKLIRREIQEGSRVELRPEEVA